MHHGLRDVEGVAQRRLRLVVSQGIQSFHGNRWLINTSLTVNTLGHAGNWLWRKGDRPHPTYTPPTPWEHPAAKFTTTQLPANNSQCTTEELRQYALMTIAKVTEPDGAVYYTDGSIDPDSGKASATFVTGGLERA